MSDGSIWQKSHIVKMHQRGLTQRADSDDKLCQTFANRWNP